MVNASLNWASIVGIVLAVGGAGLYFLRSFKPALARDYDVFFAAIGLLCGGILFFQGWRLDPILQFGQFLLAGTTVFFAYESVRLRGIATDQARRSSYFDEDLDQSPQAPNGFRGRSRDDFDRFDNAQPISRRFAPREEDQYEEQSPEEDFYRTRRTSRPAIPEQAASRRGGSPREYMNQDSARSRRIARFGLNDEVNESRSRFGERRSIRQDLRKGSRPKSSSDTNFNSRFQRGESSTATRADAPPASSRYNGPKGSPMGSQPEDAAFSSTQNSQSSSRRNNQGPTSTRSKSGPRSPENDSPPRRRYPSNSKPRDNNSRFDN